MIPYKNSELLALCKEILGDVTESGVTHENTRELVGVTLIIGVSDLDLGKEELYLRNYYGGRYETRVEEEKYHYEAIKYNLLHKVREVKYFFGQSIENRKLVVFSNDCISLVQYVKRGKSTSLLCYMRSSDLKELLPLDLFNLSLILKEVNKTYCAEEDLEEELWVVIGSAHYYLSGGRGH